MWRWFIHWNLALFIIDLIWKLRCKYYWRFLKDKLQMNLTFFPSRTSLPRRKWENSWGEFHADFVQDFQKNNVFSCVRTNYHRETWALCTLYVLYLQLILYFTIEIDVCTGTTFWHDTAHNSNKIDRLHSKPIWYWRCLVWNIANDMKRSFNNGPLSIYSNGIRYALIYHLYCCTDLTELSISWHRKEIIW